jgi:hypothetical protein
MEIKSTYDYDAFKILSGNRSFGIRESLKKSMQEKNNLLIFPILVDKDMTVLDGQNRLAIAKDLGLEVFYRHIDNSTIDDVRRWNSSSSTWTMDEFLESYCACGYENYLTIKRITKKYKVHITVFIGLFGSQTNQFDACRLFRFGKTVLKHTTEEVEKIIVLIQDIESVVKSKLCLKRIYTNHWRALYEIVSHPDYDHKRMLTNIGMHPDAAITAFHMQFVADIRKHLLDNVYNKWRKRNIMELKGNKHV